jgi:hypothetical protein
VLLATVLHVEIFEMSQKTQVKYVSVSFTLTMTMSADSQTCIRQSRDVKALFVVKVFLEKYIFAPSSNSFPACTENLRFNAVFTKPLHSILFNSVPNFTNCSSSINFNILFRYTSKTHAFASLEFYRTNFHSRYLFLECIQHVLPISRFFI